MLQIYHKKVNFDYVREIYLGHKKLMPDKR